MQRLSPRKLFTHAKDRRTHRRDRQFRPGSDLAAPGAPARLEKLEGRILLLTMTLCNTMVSGHS